MAAKLLKIRYICHVKTKKGIIEAPMGEKTVLLHTCCAPCSSAIIEAMMQNGITPVIYYCNPNIYPFEEYEIRKNECTRYAESLGLEIVDDDYDHEGWLEAVKGLEDEPERGGRCLKCFKIRLLRTARYAQSRGIKVITTTLASSRWKSLDQINEAGRWACSQISGMPQGAVGTGRLGVDVSPVMFPPSSDLPGRISAVPSASARCSSDVEAAVAPITDAGCDGMPQGAVGSVRLGVDVSPVMFWEHNWRKGGLQERRLQIINEYGFYNQLYCGCEFSMRKDV